MKNITPTEKRGYILLAIIFAFSFYFSITNLAYYDDYFTTEDGPIEWGTAIMLFAVSMTALFKLITFWKHKSALWKFGFIMFTLLFFFAAGEEISWGQRIFNIETSEFFMEHNRQKETNFHNLMVGETKLNKLVFSQLLTLVIVVYLFVVPVLYRKKEWAKNLLNKFGVPVVHWHHTIAFLISTIFVLITPSSRNWEVYELAFGFIFFLIFLHPLNKEIYEKS